MLFGGAYIAGILCGFLISYIVLRRRLIQFQESARKIEKEIERIKKEFLE